MFHVEQVKLLYKPKDHLVSQEEFNVFWNEEAQYAYTELPNKIDLDHYYQAQDYSSHKTEAKSFLDYVYVFIQRLMLSYKSSFIKKHSNQRVLDVGAGVGVFAKYLKKNGFIISTVEPSEKARNECVKKGLTCYKTVSYIPDTEDFSAITLWHVLEHLPELNQVLSQLYSKLITEGALVIAVPNLKSYDAIYYKAFWAALDVPRHLWHFTDIGLIRLLENNGFLFESQHPLWFDAFYISYMSEVQKGASFPFLRGIFIGLISNIKALFNNQYSSKVYVFRKPS